MRRPTQKRSLSRGVCLPSVPFEVPLRPNKPAVETVVRHSLRFWRPRRDLFHGLVGEFRPPLADPFTVFAVHLPSQLRGRQDAEGECRALAAEVREVESECGHERTVIVGDLNLDPYDAPVVEAGGLHAVMSRRVANRGFRHVRGKRYAYFYNPMWEVLGRGGDLPQGTYFYDRGGHVVRYWHAFDQVLVRPSLLDRLPPNGVDVIHCVGTESLLDGQGRPNLHRYSDHLPLLFTISDIHGRQRHRRSVADRHLR
jgi:hypothetical protein